MNIAPHQRTVVRLDEYRQKPRRRLPPTVVLEQPVMDDATRNLHAAASAALKLIYMTRQRLGLPQL
jgi:hypothetical protein